MVGEREIASRVLAPSPPFLPAGTIPHRAAVVAEAASAIKTESSGGRTRRAEPWDFRCRGLVAVMVSTAPQMVAAHVVTSQVVVTSESHAMHPMSQTVLATWEDESIMSVMRKQAARYMVAVTPRPWSCARADWCDVGDDGGLERQDARVGGDAMRREGGDHV